MSTNVDRPRARALTIGLETRFTEEMASLRAAGWASPVTAAATDEHDAVSYHLAIRADGCAAALVRITLASPSVLAAWSGGRAPVPAGRSVAELTRGVVAPEWRRLGLYRLAMLETMLRLRSLGATTATAAIEPEFPGRGFLARLGFRDRGAPVVFDDHPRCGTLAQSVCLEVTEAGEEGWRELRAREIAALTREGYLVDSDLPLVTLQWGGGGPRRAPVHRAVIYRAE
jgi:hypothetical protein